MAAFLGGCCGDDDLLALLKEAAERAAAVERRGAKFAKRGGARICVWDRIVESPFCRRIRSAIGMVHGKAKFRNGGRAMRRSGCPLNFAGVVAGAESSSEALMPLRFNPWARDVWKDANGLIQDGDWRRGLLDVLTSRDFFAQAAFVPASAVWVAAALSRAGWAEPAEATVNDVVNVASATFRK